VDPHLSPDAAVTALWLLDLHGLRRSEQQREELARKTLATRAVILDGIWVGYMADGEPYVDWIDSYHTTLDPKDRLRYLLCAGFLIFDDEREFRTHAIPHAL